MNNRIELIQQIIRERKVRSQEELATLLAAEGIRTTQATLSRDFKKLHISKQHDALGGAYYVLPEPAQTGQSALLSSSRAGESIVSLEISGQLCVIKTLPGCAGMAGALADAHSHPAMMGTIAGDDTDEFLNKLGTIAGDDTLLLMLRKDYVRNDFLAFLKRHIPNLDAKLIETND